MTNDFKISKSKDIAERDNQNICALGMKNLIDDKKEETHRTKYRRERDRILYSGGFRRLQDKTQVMAAVKQGDHRTRLTHTLEVEQISVSIADALNLNKDLVSAIAIGHDIGHTPFGHAVERFLDNELKSNGGFSHALQSVRYIEKQIEKEDKIKKISFEIKEGILKHDTDSFVLEDLSQIGCENNEYFIREAPGTLEAQVVYWADKIAYLTHDLEDFIKNKDNIIEEEFLEGEINEILNKLIPHQSNEYIKVKPNLTDKNTKKYETRDLVRSVINNLIIKSSKNIEELMLCNKNIEKHDNEFKQKIIRDKTNSNIEKIYKDRENDEKEKFENRVNERRADSSRQKNNLRFKRIDKYDIISTKQKQKIYKKAYQEGLIINLDDEYLKDYVELKDIINKYYVGSRSVKFSDAKAKRIIEELYDLFFENKGLVPDEFKNEEGNIDERSIADYISTMTDKYAEDIYLNLNSTGKDYQY